jgi:lyso-ornithine lipid O-acyltransferase
VLRLIVSATAAAAITAALIPVQWVALKCGWPLSRTIPVFYHRLMCRLLDLRIRVEGQVTSARPLLIIANHASWMDICVISALLPVAFVAKRDVAAWPVVGMLARLQRAIFVDRERRQRTGQAAAEIAARLNKGDALVLFAEGTSSDGNRVLPFRSALLGALDLEGTSITVQPLALSYTGWRALPAGRRYRPQLAWYGDMDLLPHLAEALRHGGIDVVARWCEPLTPAPGNDRKALARALEREVRISRAKERG